MSAFGKHALRIEQEIRALLAGGAHGTLSSAWDSAVAQLAPDFDDTFADSARRTRAAIRIDGDHGGLRCGVARADCCGMPGARRSSERRMRSARIATGWCCKLSDILKADFERSDEGRSATRLKAAVGAGFDASFDFDAMSRMLSTGAAGHTRFPRVAPSHPPAARRAGRAAVLPRLVAHKFAIQPYPFLFDNCADALAAFRERMPKLIELAKAMAIAELEIDGQYSASRHDALFEQFGANGLDPQELAPFPDYLVCVNASRLAPQEHAQLMEILVIGTADQGAAADRRHPRVSRPQGEGNLTSGHAQPAARQHGHGAQQVYVLQSSSSNLFQFRERIAERTVCTADRRCSACFSGASATLSPACRRISMAAAAMESRAFPAFTYDPSAGPNWASRFSLDANSQVDLDWPVQAFAYEDESTSSG